MNHASRQLQRRRLFQGKKPKFSTWLVVVVVPPAALMLASIKLVLLLSAAINLVVKLPDASQPSDSLEMMTLISQDCEDYGCPMYPLDIESDFLLVNESTEQVASHEERLQVPFASKTAATVTRRGNEGHPNQDRAFIMEPFLTRQTPDTTRSFLMTILDGHGTRGHLVSHYLRTAIPRRLAEKLNARPFGQSDDWIKQQLNETFIEVDQEGSPNLLTGGSTASVTLRIGAKLYFANCGDSLTILVKQDKTAAVKNYKNQDGDDESGSTILYKTRRDKAYLPDERKRIEDLGGTIFIPLQFPTQSRVIVYSVASLPREPIGLAMSRSIGDWEWKLYGVIAEPIVDVVSIADLKSDQDGDDAALFIIAASDGVWDMRPRREFFAKRFGKAIVADTDPLWKTCVATMWAVAPAKPSWYRDDMTMLVMTIT